MTGVTKADVLLEMGLHEVRVREISRTGPGPMKTSLEKFVCDTCAEDIQRYIETAPATPAKT
jgi:hypothetical protein